MGLLSRGRRSAGFPYDDCTPARDCVLYILAVFPVPPYDAVSLAPGLEEAR